MSQTISAIYENGRLILEEPLSISEGSKVEVLIISKGKTDETGEIDESDEWTDEDLRDVTIASLRYWDESENEAAE